MPSGSWSSGTSERHFARGRRRRPQQGWAPRGGACNSVDVVAAASAAAELGSPVTPRKARGWIVERAYARIRATLSAVRMSTGRTTSTSPRGTDKSVCATLDCASLLLPATCAPTRQECLCHKAGSMWHRHSCLCPRYCQSLTTRSLAPPTASGAARPRRFARCRRS
jgi:hypothetical protein